MAKKYANKIKTIKQDLLRELFDYKNGQLFWRIDKSYKTKAGSIAGCLCKNSGYVKVGINKKQYQCHRLIWIWNNGDILSDFEIDHINGIRNDNRIENLRLVTSQENKFNRKDVKGYVWDKSRNKWLAYINLNNKFKNLGRFDKEEDARNAYLNAKKELHQISIH